MTDRTPVVLLLLLLGSALQGCTHCPRVESEPEIRRDVVVATAASRLRAETRNGDIVVRAGTAPGEVQVTSHVVGIGPTAEAALAVRDRIEIVTGQRDGTVSVGWQWTTPPGDCEEARVRFEITAPPEWEVSLESRNGDVAVHGVGGAGVELETSNGDVRGLDVAGAIKVETSNGSVQLKGSMPSLDVESSNGSIRIELDGTGPVSGAIESSNGNVTVWVGERSCAVEAKSSNGGIRLHSGGAGEAGGVDVSSKGRGRVSFGDPAVAEQNELQIRTSNGKVEVRKGGE